MMGRNITQSGKGLGLLGAYLACLPYLGSGVQAQSLNPPVTQSLGSWNPKVDYVAGNPVPIEIPMDDGEVLRGNITYPLDPVTRARARGAFPVVLEYTQYLNGGAGTRMVPYGYISAEVYVRGTQSSGGKFDFFGERVGADGAQVVRWLAKQEGALPSVGMMGCSAVALSQIATAAAIGPDSPLKAIIPGDAGGSMVRDVILANGVPSAMAPMFNKEFVGAAVGNTPSAAERYDEIFPGSVMSGTGWAYDTPGLFDRHPYTDEAMRRTAANGIATLFWTQYQGAPTGQAAMFAYMQNAYALGPKAGNAIFGPMSARRSADPRVQLVVHEGTHCQHIDPFLEMRWFDTWLKGKRTGVESTTTPIHMQDRATGGWVHARTMPMTDHYTQFFLGHASGLERTAGETGTSRLVFAQPDELDGKLVFNTRAFDGSTTLGGFPSASIYAATPGKNLHLFAVLEDVAPDGGTTYITSGNVLGSLSQQVVGDDAPKVWKDATGVVTRPYNFLQWDRYLTANEIRRFDIRFDPVVWKLRAGHYVRLNLQTQVAASICYRAFVTGMVRTWPCFFTPQQRKSLPGVYTISYGKGYESSLNLPLVRESELKVATAAPTPTSDGFPLPLDW